MNCPKCGFDASESASECGRCGIIFAKLGGGPPPRRPGVLDDLDEVDDGRIGKDELTILGGGLAAAIIVYAIPFTRFVFSALVTLFHELGHAIAGWLLGHPSIPAFDFVYGGGFTHQSIFRRSIAVLVAGVFAYGLWHFRQNKKSVVVIGSLFLIWLFFVTAEWRRELAIAAAGHLFEFILAGILFYQSLSGEGWRNAKLERPLGAFAAFFVQIHSMLFAARLTRDAEFLASYREGKGGALMNDLEVVALNLNIWAKLNPGIEGVARLLLLFSVLPMVVGVVWYIQRRRWHRVLRSLRTVDA